MRVNLQHILSILTVRSITQPNLLALAILVSKIQLKLTYGRIVIDIFEKTFG